MFDKLKKIFAKKKPEELAKKEAVTEEESLKNFEKQITDEEIAENISEEKISNEDISREGNITEKSRDEEIVLGEAVSPESVPEIITKRPARSIRTSA